MVPFNLPLNILLMMEISIFTRDAQCTCFMYVYCLYCNFVTSMCVLFVIGLCVLFATGLCILFVSWEIAHLGSCHLGIYPWEVTLENAFGKVLDMNIIV